MATVLTIVNQSESLISLFSFETQVGPVVVVYFDEERLRTMIRALIHKVESQGVRLGRAEIDGETLDECIADLARKFPGLEARFISDGDPRWPKLLTAFSQLPGFPLARLDELQ
jgi:hypothetical protein